MEHFGGGNWAMIPNFQPHSNPATLSNQENIFIQPQHFNQQQYQPPPPLQQQNQSLASHFDLLHLVENLSNATENATRDQHTDALVGDLNQQFEKCQQLLNSIAGTIKAKPKIVGEPKCRLEETEKLLCERRYTHTSKSLYVMLILMSSVSYFCCLVTRGAHHFSDMSFFSWI